MKLFLGIDNIVLAFVLICTSIQATARCGVLRWSVKTGSDQDIAKVDLSKIKSNTIENLVNLVAPKNLPQSSRVSPTETEVYQLKATLLEVNQTDDSDYHLLISDLLGHQMIAEIPDPQCVSSISPVRVQIQNARKYIDQKIQVTNKPQKVNIPITVTGIGFFDVPHAQGAAVNGIEIHPVLDINFSNTQQDLFAIKESSNLQVENVISNFLPVTDNLFRGGRPNTEDLAALKFEKNIQTVINLENKISIVEQENKVAMNLGLKFFSVPMDTSVRPSDEQVNKILLALQEANNFPIFIYCHHDHDLLGLIIGLYRIEVQGWSPAIAYQEMLSNGFHSNRVVLDKYYRNRTGFSGK